MSARKQYVQECKKAIMCNSTGVQQCARVQENNNVQECKRAIMCKSAGVQQRARFPESNNVQKKVQYCTERSTSLVVNCSGNEMLGNFQKIIVCEHDVGGSHGGVLSEHDVGGSRDGVLSEHDVSGSHGVLSD